MLMREDCEKGFFVSFDYSSDALQEIESFFKRSHKVIVALTVQEILDEHIAKKLVWVARRMKVLVFDNSPALKGWAIIGCKKNSAGGRPAEFELIFLPVQ
jgi:hypothetical protein